MNVFAKFDEIPSMILEVIKETKHYGHILLVGRSVVWTDNVKTVYPPSGGYNKSFTKLMLIVENGSDFK